MMRARTGSELGPQRDEVIQAGANKNFAVALKKRNGLRNSADKFCKLRPGGRVPQANRRVETAGGNDGAVRLYVTLLTELRCRLACDVLRGSRIHSIPNHRAGGRNTLAVG